MLHDKFCFVSKKEEKMKRTKVDFSQGCSASHYTPENLVFLSFRIFFYQKIIPDVFLPSDCTQGDGKQKNNIS
jgi:hypothetical protein